ncbi:MAG: NADPH-dependent F420 reductase [Candidatus Methanofastidiosia archaeon]
MKIVALLGGTGEQGIGLAARFCKAGRKVIIGSRKDEKAKRACERVKEILPTAEVSGFENLEAAKRGEIIILSVPFQHAIWTLRSVKEGLTEGKILVSQLVPLQANFGGRPTQVFQTWQGSVSEMIKSVVPRDVEVVSAFHNVGEKRLLDIKKPIECDIVVCGDSKEAKKEIMELAECIEGVRGIDGGKLSNSRFIEPLTAFLIGLNKRYKIEGAGIRFTYLE